MDQDVVAGNGDAMAAGAVGRMVPQSAGVCGLRRLTAVRLQPQRKKHGSAAGDESVEDQETQGPRVRVRWK